MKLDNVKKGERLSFTYYVEVLNVDKKKEAIDVKDSNGQTFTIQGQDLIEGITSASQFEKEEKLNRTQLVEKLQTAGDSVFTAKFVKQTGDDRTMIARLVGSENLMGRSNVIDMEATGNVIKQIDHRTLHELILKGTKYTLKK